MLFEPSLKDKIDIQIYKPGFVATKMSRKRVGFTIPDTMTAAEGALKDLGKRETSYGVIDHEIVNALMNFVAANLPSLIGRFMFTNALATKKRLDEKAALAGVRKSTQS